jgi:hypothetical protein
LFFEHLRGHAASALAVAVVVVGAMVVRMGIIAMVMGTMGVTMVVAMGVAVIMGMLVLMIMAVMRAIGMDVVMRVAMRMIMRVVGVVMVRAMGMGVVGIAMLVGIMGVIGAVRVDVIMRVPVLMAMAVARAVGVDVFMRMAMCMIMRVMAMVAMIPAAIVMVMAVAVVAVVVAVVVVAVAVAVVMMTMVVSVMVSVIVPMIVTMRHGGGEIGAAFRIERRGQVDHLGAEPFQHVGDHVIAAQPQPVLQDLHVQVPVADMPGETGQRGGIGRLHFHQLFRHRDDLHDAAILKHDAVIHAQRNDIGEVEQHLRAACRVMHHPALGARVEVEEHAVDDAGLVIGSGGGNGIGAKHGCLSGSGR